MVFMALRLVEIWRVLKPDGGMYLHCDPHASHYLKQTMRLHLRTQRVPQRNCVETNQHQVTRNPALRPRQRQNLLLHKVIIRFRIESAVPAS